MMTSLGRFRFRLLPGEATGVVAYKLITRESTTGIVKTSTFENMRQSQVVDI